MELPRLLVLASSVALSASVFATDTTISANTTSQQTFEGVDTITINSGVTVNYAGSNALQGSSGASGTITNNGVIQAQDDGIFAEGANGLTITNTGTIFADDTSGGSGYDAIDVGGSAGGAATTNVTITNSGTIWVAEDHAIQATSSTGIRIENQSGGLISAEDKGIELDNTTNAVLINTGTIEASSNSLTVGATTYNKNTSSSHDNAVYASGAANISITNNSGGTISAAGDYAINLSTAAGADITNAGTISADGDTINLQNASGVIAITNNGTITSTNNFAISANNITSGSVLITNNGTITAGNLDAVYVDHNTVATTIRNNGTITAGNTKAIDGDATTNLTVINTGTLSSLGKTVYMASGGALTNTGTIKATTVSNSAIYIDNANNTVTLGEGSVIIGDIELEASTATGNTIKFDVGSARSYVYSVTNNSNSWILTDLDGRTAIQGSAKAAGVGNVETADEALFNRTNAINNSLARYARLQNNETWADVYVGASKRDADTTTVNKYKHNLGGVTIVQPRNNNTQLIMALQRSNLDISDNVQDVDSTSISIGLQKANAYKGFTGRAIVSYNDYDSSQEVLDNSSSTGYTTYTGDYDSLGLTLGLNKVHNHGDVTVTLDGEIAHERIDGYSETATFTWKDRNLTQATLSASGLWKKSVSGKDVFVNAGVTARGLISGKKANYKIDTTNTSFDGGNQSEVMATFGAGVDYNLDTDAVARFEVQGGYSNRKTASASIATTLDWKF